MLLGSIPLYGQERGNIEVMRALAESGAAEVLFVTHSEWGHQVIQPELDRLGLPWTVARYAGRFSKGMEIGQWLKNFRDMALGSWQLFRIVRRFEPTHFHVGNPAFFLNFLPCLLISRVPMVYRVGDEPSLHNTAYCVLWQKLIVPRVAKFVAISNFVKKRMLAVPVSDEKVVVVYNHPPDRETLANDDNLPSALSRPIFLYTGQIIREKGVDLLVAAAYVILEKHPRATFLFAGDYSWQNLFAEELIGKIHQDGFSESIQFLGYRHDVFALLSQADLHICPSICNEGLGNVVIEAKLAGKASIVFPSGGLPELIRHGVDGYICPEKTSEALASAIEYYLADPGKMIEHGKAAYDSLEDVFEMSKFADKWVQVYRETCKE